MTIQFLRPQLDPKAADIPRTVILLQDSLIHEHNAKEKKRIPTKSTKPFPHAGKSEKNEKKNIHEKKSKASIRRVYNGAPVKITSVR